MRTLISILAIYYLISPVIAAPKTEACPPSVVFENAPPTTSPPQAQLPSQPTPLTPQQPPSESPAQPTPQLTPQIPPQNNVFLPPSYIPSQPDPLPQTPIEVVADQARREELLQNSQAQIQIQEQAIQNDSNYLENKFNNTTPANPGAKLQQANTQLKNQIKEMERSTEITESAEIAKQKNYSRDALQKTQLALQDLKQNPELKLPQYLLATPQAPNPPASQTPDDLINRTLLLSALKPTDSKGAIRQLNLGQAVTLTTNGKKSISVPLINGKKRNHPAHTVDCTTLISTIYPDFWNNSFLSSLDYMSMWHLLYEGRLPRQIKYTQKRASLIVKMSQAFRPMQLKNNEPLQPGDVFISFKTTAPFGGVYVVKRFDSITKKLEVIDSIDQTGSVVTKQLPYDPTSKDGEQLGLRLKINDSVACRYVEKIRKNASLQQD